MFYHIQEHLVPNCNFKFLKNCVSKITKSSYLHSMPLHMLGCGMAGMCTGCETFSWYIHSIISWSVARIINYHSPLCNLTILNLWKKSKNLIMLWILLKYCGAYHSKTTVTLLCPFWIWCRGYGVKNQRYPTLDFENSNFLDFSCRLCFLSIPRILDTTCLCQISFLVSAIIFSRYTAGSLPICPSRILWMKNWK